jgi:predicted ATPase
VAAQPLRERLRAQLMQALHRSGRTADALAVYREYRSLLRDELGLAPSPALRKLEESILRDDVSLQDPSEVAVGRSNLPAPLTRLIGREVETGRVSDLLEQSRLVTLVGPGGAGKTRLAVEAVTRQLAAGEVARDGAWLVELASLEDPALLPGAVLDGVSPRLELARLDARGGVDEGGGGSGRLLRALEPRHLLLVLDNCEHLVEPVAGLVEAILAACPGVRVLATSREALRVPGELRLPVPALPVPPEDPDGSRELLAFDAGRLFVERARAVVPSLRLGVPEARAVARICRRLDGLPFAIELAAARVNVLPVTELQARLHDRFRLLTSGARTALPRQRTLRAVVDWSWELLTPAERVALRRLAVFAGGCTLEAAERVCAGPGLAAGEVPGAVAGLVEKSLVEVAPETTLPMPSWPGIERADLPPVPAPPAGEPRYRLLETIRAYAAERLAEAGEPDRAAGAHAAWCIAEIEVEEARLRGTDQLLWWTRAHAEHANLRAGLRWLLDRGDAAGAVRLAGALAWHQGFFGHRDEALADLRGALALPGGPRDRVRAEALATHAWLGMWAGDGPALFEARIGEAAAIFREVGEEVHARMIASFGRSLRGHLRRAERGSRPATGSPALDDYDRQALDAVLATDRWTHAIAWYAMVTVMSVALERVTAGDLPGARRDAEALLERLERRGDRLGMIDCHELLAGVSMFEGDLQEAEARLREALRLACELRYPAEMAVQLTRLGELELGRGDLAAARGHLLQGLAAFRQFGLPDMAASIGNGLGMVANLEGDLETARAEHGAALDLYRRLGDEFGVAATEVLLGLVAARGGEPDQAAELLDRALASARRTSNPMLASFALGGMAIVAAEAGDAERAAMLFGAAVWRGGVSGSLMFGRRVIPWPLPSSLVDGAIAAARRVLGEEAFEAARARGRELGPDRVAPGEGRPPEADRLGARQGPQPSRR